MAGIRRAIAGKRSKSKPVLGGLRIGGASYAGVRRVGKTPVKTRPNAGGVGGRLANRANGPRGRRPPLM